MSAALRELLEKLPESSHIRIATTLAPPRKAVATGLPEIDALLVGGLPRGCLCELVGPGSAGRTAVALATLASATRRGEVVAFIDLADALDPPSLETAGVDLERVLWVRPRSAIEGMRAADLVLQAEGFGLAVIDLCDAPLTRKDARLVAISWTRLQRAAERSGCTLLVLGERPIAGGHATVTLEMTRHAVALEGSPALLERIDSLVRLVRSRSQPPGRTTSVKLLAA